MEVNVNLAGQITRSLWDTGCSITYCDREAIPASLRQRIESPRTTTARTANGSRITFDRSIQLPIIIQRSKVYHTIHVTHGRNCPAPLIIGTDLQTKLTLSGRITTDYNKRCLELDNGERLDFVNAIGCFNAMLDEAAEKKAAEPLIAGVAVDTTLRPRTDNLAKGVILEGADPNKTYIVEQKQHRFTMKVGKVLVKPDADGTIPLRLLNMGNNSITIPKGATVAYVTEATVHKPNNEASKAEDSDFDATDQELADILEQPTEDWVEQVEKLDLSKTVLNHQQRKQLRRLLLRKAKAFLHKGRRLGRYTGSVRHRIRLIEGTKPIARRAHRTPLALQDAMLKELQKLIDQDLIRLSDSPFAAPTLLLKKKDGSYRFVVDYRAINQHIAPQQYVLANIQTLVDICGGRKLFSTMDYSQAYHQIPVAEEDIPLKAFITEFGLFEWTVCPYGMVNSGETFSKMMKELARQMSFRILCFVDDVIIASDSVDRHLHDLEEFLTVVENNNLTVNLAKCVFARGEINYLGLVISHEGTRPDPGKVKAILETSRPTDMTAMRRFLGMVNYLRRHIRNCAQILRPLNDICKGERLGEWGPSQEAAFTEIKRCLTTAPVLASPRIGVPYVLETDASIQGLGYCLLQPDEEGVNHVICYGSRKTTKHEEKKDPCVLEALAVRWSLDQVAPYMVGGPTTTVRTDNTAVTALLTKEDRTVTSQMNKFRLALQAYPIKLEHRAGKTNYVADYLSRYPTDHQPQATKQATAQAQQANAITSDDLRLTASRIRAEQQRDDCIKANYDELTRKPRRGQQLASAPTGASSNFSVIKYNVHYQATAADKPRIYLPQRLRESAIRELHEDAFSGGHLGITKCTEKVRQRFYWPHLPEEVAQIITSCEKCQLRKAPPAAVSKEPLHKWPTPQWPMQRIHIDIYGALPLTAKRHRYALTSVCALTKFVVMVPLRNQTFDDVKDALLSHAFSKYGVPSYIASDQGSQFMGSQFAEFSKEYGFEHLAISAHHQSANAQAERFHATIGNMIATYSNENGSNWDIHLPLLTMALNSSVHRIIGNSAFWAMFGREANLPIDLRTHAFQGERFGRPERG
ncbi:pol polyprotein [Aphelenchoides avenae]|nr:pol polyprotein [Aphelenchus avenae]